MQIKVEILPWLSTTMRPGTVGRISLEHRLSGKSFRDLVRELAAADPAFARLIYDRESDGLRYPAMAVINDQLLEFLHGLDSPLADGDSVSFMSTYTGG